MTRRRAESSSRVRTRRRSPPSSPVAVIDIGTNSTKLLVGRARAGRVRTVHFARETTRLGAGLGRTGRIGDAAASRTIRVVRRFAAAARRLRGQIRQSGRRVRANGRAVAARIARETGIPVRVLKGREEAIFSFYSARARLARPRAYLVVIDVGGGSTELVVAERDRVRLARSLPLGALRLTERHLRTDPIAHREYGALTDEIEAVIARVASSFDVLRPQTVDLVACGGSATTALDMVHGGRRRSYQTMQALTRAEVRRLEQTCLRTSVAQRRRLPGLPPDRADIIPAGIAVLIAFMTYARKRSVWISDGGIREGVILAQAK
jgi:exopolyphosphatase/guanosine-5'-triphosphate,3'-diphosphate pyrophosphatase